MPCHWFKEASKIKHLKELMDLNIASPYKQICEIFLTFPYVGCFFLLVLVAFFPTVALLLLPAACSSAMSSHNSFLWGKGMPAWKINFSWLSHLVEVIWIYAIIFTALYAALDTLDINRLTTKNHTCWFSCGHTCTVTLVCT